MNAAARRLHAVTRAGRPLLVCYLPVGDPDTACATPAFYVEHGVDVVEAGVAVPDPVLDGPEVAASMRRALGAGGGGADAADLLREGLAAADDPATVWMSYVAGATVGLDVVVGSGAGAVLMPDTDPQALARAATGAGLSAVAFCDHEPTPDQLRAAAETSAYTMLAAASGVTGERAVVGADNAELVRRVRAAGGDAPVLLGFGLSTPDHVRAALDLGADGAIVGSACVRAARAGAAELGRLLTGLRAALDG